MSVGSQQYVVGTTALSIAKASAGPSPGPAAGLVITNISGGATTAYLGGSGVKTTNGLPLAQNATIVITLSAGDELYAIVASGTATLAVLQT